MINLLADFRFAARTLLKNLGFAAVAVITLGLGIGANTAIFSVVNTSLLTPLPYPEPEEVLIFWETDPEFGDMSISWLNYQDWRREVAALEEMAVYRRDRFNLTGAGEPEQVRVTMVSANLFDALSLSPMLGRGFTEAEDRPGGDPVTVLSHGYWQRRFGADTGVVGTTIRLDDRSYHVVGVMPPELRHPTRSDLFVPIGQFSDDPVWQERGNHPGIYGLGRMAEGVTLTRAQAEIDTIAEALEAEYPGTNAGQRVSYRVLQDHAVSDIRAALLLLSGAVALVLLIACVNVANLLLARGVGRERELAIRTAMGAGRRQIVRQLLTESLLLAMVGGLLGVALAFLGVDAMAAIYGSDLPGTEEIGIDKPVLAFTLGISMLAGVLFGLGPAWQSTGRRLNPLQAGSRTGQSADRARFQSGLVIAEIALAVVLLVGAGLLLRSFAEVLDVDPGLDANHVLTASVSLPAQRYGSDDEIRRFWGEVLTRVGALPGVAVAGITTNLPFVGGNQTSFAIAGRPEPGHGQFPFGEYAEVTPGYFDALGITLLSGRLIDERDSADGPLVMLVDEAFAKTHWPAESPLAKEVVFGGAHSEQRIRVTVIGVVETVRHNGLDTKPLYPQMYFPFAQRPEVQDVMLVVRTEVPPASLVDSVRRAVLEVDPDQPIYDAQPYRAIVEDSLADRRLGMSLFGFFAVVAAILALVGVYGVVSYGVTQRTQEVGVRMAMGARARDVLMLVLRQVGVLALAGAAAGVACAFLLAPAFRSELYGIGARDPLTFGLAAVAVLAFALLACLLPARRAMRIQPTEALQYE